MKKAKKVLANYPGVVASIDDRASCNGFVEENPDLFPKSPGDYLAWIEDEADIQEAHAHSLSVQYEDGSYDENIKATKAWRNTLMAVSRELRGLGVEPTTLPWETVGEIVQPNPD